MGLGFRRVLFRLWTKNAIYADRYFMSISTQAEGPAQFNVEYGWWGFTTKENFKAYRAHGAPMGALILHGGSLLSATPPPGPAITQRAVFGRALQLNGYSLLPANGSIQAGDILNLDLNWEELAPVNEDFSVFVHIESADGKLITQD